jgi:Putative transposase/Transposase zinc-binding domain
MERKHPFRELLRSKRKDWDRAGTPAHIRTNFSKASDCGTAALGAEVFASTTETKVSYHTCKSKFCPSCGVQATQLWQAEIEAALPDIQYVNINLTMPDALWPFLQEHPGLLHDFSALAAHAIMSWAYSRYRVRLLVMVVPQTFGGLLNFHPHFHVLVSAGGLREAAGEWVPRVQFDKEELMESWRFAVIAYLGRMADLLSANPDQLKQNLKLQYARRWNIFVGRCISKTQFLRYAGRYLRRPPIAESRLTFTSNDELEYDAKNTRAKQRVRLRVTPDAFLNLIGQHVPQHYAHGVRYFGLLAPRTKHATSGLFSSPLLPKLIFVFPIYISSVCSLPAVASSAAPDPLPAPHSASSSDKTSVR